MTVDRTDARPLYLQVTESLRREILGHDLPPGSALPSEAELQRRFGVARSVVRQAVARLAEDGLVHRQQGRPSIVTAPAEHRRLVQRATGLFEQFARRGYELRTRIDELVEDTPPPDVRAFLKTDDALRLQRLRSVEDDPLSYVRTWLPRGRLPGLTAAMLSDTSLHQVLTRDFGLRPVSGRRQIRSVAADERVAETLQVAVGEPLLLLEGETSDQHGRPLEYFSTWHRADKVVFDVDVSESTEVMQLGVAGTAADRGDLAEPAVGDLRRVRELVAELQRLLG